MKYLAVIVCVALLTGCLTNTYETGIAALSFGDLQGRKLQYPAGTPIRMCHGEDSGNPAKLSVAVERALAGTGCDTLMDVAVTTKSSQFWCLWFSTGSTTLTVEGKCVRSIDLPKEVGK